MRSVGNLSASHWRDTPAILRGILSSSDLLDGSAIARYETALAAYMGGGEAISFRAARTGLSAILQAAGLKPADEIIVTGYTCVVVPNAAIFQGIRPIYVDIDPRTYNMDPEAVEAAITERTRAIIIQSTYGLPPQMDRLLSIAKNHGLFVIEDNAVALGSELNGQLMGTFGDAAIISSEQSKCISTAKGGVAYTQNKELAAKIRDIQASAQWPDAGLVRKELGYLANLALIQGPRLFEYQLPAYYLSRLGLIYLSEWQDREWTCVEPPGYMQRMPNSHARVAISQLKQLPRFVARRRRIAEIYRTHLPDLGYAIPQLVDGAEPSLITFPILVKDRNHIRQYLSERKIFTGNWFEATIHPAVVDPADAFYEAGSCPRAENVARHVITLPTAPRMNEADAHRLLDALGTYHSEFPAFAPQTGNPDWPFEDHNA